MDNIRGGKAMNMLKTWAQRVRIHQRVKALRNALSKIRLGGIADRYAFTNLPQINSSE